MKRFIPFLVSIVFPLFVGIATVNSAVAEQITVRAAAHKDYGRIVFKWPEPVPFDAKIAGKRLIVSFGSPIEASYRRVTRSLRQYVRSARAGADGRSVSFALKGEFGVRSFYSGSAVVVDLIKKPTKEAAKKKSSKKAAKKTARKRSEAQTGSSSRGPVVRLRTGVHKKYTRLVFDWPRKVPYKLSRSGGTASLTFERPARISLGRAAKRPPRHVQRIRTGAADGKATVTITAAATSKIKHFYAGRKVVVDVMAPGTQKAAPKTTASSKKPAQKTASVAPKKTSKTKSKKPTPLVPGKPTALTPLKKTKATKDGKKEKQAPQKKQAALTKGAKSAGPAAVTIQSSASTGPIKGVQLRFNWDEPVAAAVFRRSGFLWTIFDKPSPLDMNALRAAGGNIIRSLEQVPSKGATIIRMGTIAGVNPNLKRDGLSWILEFRKQPLKPKAAIESKPQPNSPVGARLFLPVPEPGEAIAVNDPVVGDNLVVVPVIPLGHGVLQRHRYAQVDLLPTAQGVVIQPLIDNLRIRPLRQGIELTSQSRFDISPVTAVVAAAAAQGKGGIIRELTRAMDLKKWRKSNILNVRAERQKHMHAIAKAKGSSLKEQARLNLARLFVAHGFSAEALGVLRRIREERPGVKDEAEFNMLHGVSNYLMNRIADAKKDFEHKSLADNDEGKFWRAILLEQEDQPTQAAPELRKLGAIIRPYPHRLKMPLSLIVARNAVKVGDPKTARRYLKIVQAEKNLEGNVKADLDFAYGKFYELAGGFTPAVKKWESAIKGPDRLIRAKAAVARTELLLKTKKMNRKEAAAEYEKLRFAWRGDEFEFKLLRRLGSLYMEIGDYRNGLRTLKQAATHFREHPQAPAVTQEMADAFSELFLENGADKLKPVTAIAIYEEFKELTPVGVKGDEMIRNLADRLVAVDLLGRGAKLLDNQIKFRLKGVDRARVGARLTLVHIMDQKYEKALSVLSRTNVAGMPASLRNQRRYLQARAYIGLNQKDNALKLLDDDETISANLLRLDLFWKERDWPSTTQVLQQIIKQYGAEPGQPLEDKQAKAILDMAVALTLARNERGIGRLRRKFGKAMQNTPFRDAFQLIASRGAQGLLDYRTITGKVKEVENFQAFMTAYRERLKKQKLSSLN